MLTTKAFVLFQDKSGELTYEEFLNGIRHAGVSSKQLSAKDVDLLVSVLDVDGDGVVTIDGGVIVQLICNPVPHYLPQNS